MISRVYKTGKKVVQEGTYVCIPCGYRRYLCIGDIFPKCDRCINISKPISDEEFLKAEVSGDAINEFADDLYAGNLETWELLETK